MQYISDLFVVFLDNKNFLMGYRTSKMLRWNKQPSKLAQHSYNHSYNKGSSKMKLISENLGLFTRAELRFSTLMRDCTAINYKLTEYDFLILG